MPLQSIKQTIAMHHGRRLKVLLLEHCVLMIDVCSTQTSLSGAGFGLQAQKPYLFLPFWYQETWQWVYSSWGCMLVEVGPEFPSRLMCFHTTWQITGSKTYFFFLFNEPKLGNIFDSATERDKDNQTLLISKGGRPRSPTQYLFFGCGEFQLRHQQK